MLYLALLPLLAMSGAMAGPFRRSGSSDWSGKTDTNNMIFLDPINGERAKETERYAIGYSDMNCKGQAYKEEGKEGYDMEDRKFIHQPSIKSFMPGKTVGGGDVGGGGGQVAGTFCLLKYKKTDVTGRECIDSSQLFKIDYNHGPECINVDGDFESFSWERTYDYTPKCPEGCYEPGVTSAPHLTVPSAK